MISEMKKALITGVTGQDGSYLADLLLSKGYEVHGMVRRTSIFNTKRIEYLFSNKNFHTHYGDMSDSSNMRSLINSIQPDEVYNLAAQSHVGASFEIPEYTADVVGIGTIRLLDAIKDVKPDARLYQASTSELFGGVPGTEPQNELTPFTPKSPYAAAKLYAYWIVNNYRNSYELFASNGILFNHESPRRGENFVTKKITRGVAQIEKGSKEPITLGNLDSVRDWGHAKDFAYAQWLILNHNQPDDFVVATGEARTVREFVEESFAVINKDVEWAGSGLDERGIEATTGQVLVNVNSRYFRPAEVDILLGDPTKAKKVLGWEKKISFEEMVKDMVMYDLNFSDYGYDNVHW